MADDYTTIWRQQRKQAKFKLRLRRQRSAVFPTCVVSSPHTRDFYLTVNSSHSTLIIHVVHYTFPGVFI